MLRYPEPLAVNRFVRGVRGQPSRAVESTTTEGRRGPAGSPSPLAGVALRLATVARSTIALLREMVNWLTGRSVMAIGI